MSATTTPGSALGQRMECGICWAIYDPLAGDPVGQVPEQTAFEALPADWCCPNCEAPKHKFMVVCDD